MQFMLTLKASLIDDVIVVSDNGLMHYIPSQRRPADPPFPDRYSGRFYRASIDDMFRVITIPDV